MLYASIRLSNCAIFHTFCMPLARLRLHCSALYIRTHCTHLHLFIDGCGCRKSAAENRLRLQKFYRCFLLEC